jgi:CDP-glucose 4,6-dehydratase
LVTSAFLSSFFPSAELGNHGIAVASARAGNAIGGGDWTRDQLIPDLVRSFTEGRPCPIRNPEAIRPWQFVLEPLRGYLLLAERLASGEEEVPSAWNFGPLEGDARPVSWVADRVAGLWGQGASWVQDGGSHPHESALLKLDSSRAAAHLEWQPMCSLDDTLRWIVDWYKNHQSGGDVRQFTDEQIRRYTAP